MAREWRKDERKKKKNWKEMLKWWEEWKLREDEKKNWKETWLLQGKNESQEERKRAATGKEERIKRRKKYSGVQEREERSRKGGKDQKGLSPNEEKTKSMSWNARGKSVKDYLKSGPSPSQGPNSIAMDTIKAQFKPNCQAQSELGPEIFKAHFEYAPATSKLQIMVELSTRARQHKCSFSRTQ